MLHFLLFALVLLANCHVGELSCRRTVVSTNCSVGELSVGEMSDGELSVGELSVHLAKLSKEFFYMFILHSSLAYLMCTMNPNFVHNGPHKLLTQKGFCR